MFSCYPVGGNALEIVLVIPDVADETFDVTAEVSEPAVGTLGNFGTLGKDGSVGIDGNFGILGREGNPPFPIDPSCPTKGFEPKFFTLAVIPATPFGNGGSGGDGSFGLGMFTDGADMLGSDGRAGADILGTDGNFGVNDAALGTDGIVGANELMDGIVGAFTLGMLGTVIPLMMRVLHRFVLAPILHQP